MACGGCGGGDVKVTRKANSIPRKRQPLQIRQTSTTKTVISDKQPNKTTAKTISTAASPKSTKKVLPVAKVRNTIKLCPLCGAVLSIEYLGQQKRKRGRCNRCKKLYSLD